MPEPSATPQPSPVPPPSGIYGLPLKPYGGDLHEDLPDGGYILWKIQKDANGNNDWRPFKYHSPEKGISI